MQTTKKVLAVMVVLSAASLRAQQYVISTYAGGAPLATPTPGVTAPIGLLQGLTADGAGNVYFGSADSVFKLDQKGILTRVAGNSRQGYSGDGGPATSAQLFSSNGLALDAAGNLFVADVGRVRKVSSSGIITTVAGNGNRTRGFLGDGGPATDASFSASGVAVDQSGNLFIADIANGRIRKVSPSGIITTVAGNGSCCVSEDGVPAVSTSLNFPTAVAVDRSGNLFIANIANVQRILKVSPDGIITTVAGGGTNIPGDGEPATSADLYYPRGVALDDAGNLFIADSNRIRKVSPDGIITTVAGNGRFGADKFGLSGDGGPAAAAQLSTTTGVAVDGAGNLFIEDSNNQRIRKVSADGIITSVAGGAGYVQYVGDGTACCFSGDGGPATSAQLSEPWDVAADGAGNVFVADLGNHRIRKISPSGNIATVAGDGTSCANGVNGCAPPGDGGAAIRAQVSEPLGVAVDSAGDIYIADPSAGRIRKVSPDGSIITAAGGGTALAQAGGSATGVALYSAARVTVDGKGNLFVMDGQFILKVSPDGILTTVAGNGKVGFGGDGGLATAASLDTWDPAGCDGPGGGMALDAVGDLVFADTDDNRVREISASGIITTVAGGGTSFPGDGASATSALLGEPSSVAIDGAGNLFIADWANDRIRRVSAGGTITTVAGNGSYGYSGDGGPATAAALGEVSGVAVDGVGNIYVADADNNTVRVLRPVNHSVLIGAVVDAASQRATSVSPGKIVVIYGAGLGPAQLVQNQASNGQFGTQAGGTTVSFNGIAAPLLYASDKQVAAIVPYSIASTTALVTVTYNGETSDGFSVQVAPSAPSLFTVNQTGAGQAAAINSDGTSNTAANPVKIGGTISLYATGEGQTSPGGVDGQLSSSSIRPLLPVSVTIGGIPALVQYAGAAPGQAAGLMQVNVQIPNGVQPGGYVPVVLQVGDAFSTPDAVWIAIWGN